MGLRCPTLGVSGAGRDDLEPLIRGAYRNVPPHTAGMCTQCTAPTSSAAYDMCVPCKSYASSGLPLASGGVIPLSWAPMDSQGYQDLRQYKEPGATAEQLLRLRAMFALALVGHAGCILPESGKRRFAFAHVPSTSGVRTGEHPLQTHFISMLAAGIPRLTPRYVGPTGGDRNARRTFNPSHWDVDAPVGGLDRVLVLDDTWVSGGHAQSVASAFEQRGVRARIIVLGRALIPSRTDHGRFLRDHSPMPFDSRICPLHRMIH